jgi:hypothetical protein
MVRLAQKRRGRVKSLGVFGWETDVFCIWTKNPLFEAISSKAGNQQQKRCLRWKVLKVSVAALGQILVALALILVGLDLELAASH